MSQPEIIQELIQRYHAIVAKYIHQPEVFGLSRAELLTAIQAANGDALIDLEAYVKRDPAASGSHRLVTLAYQGFHAVSVYRLTHRLWRLGKTLQLNGLSSILCETARRISEKTKNKTGIEIHPGAELGVPFVIDHGYGVVIGETTKAGKNCYILNNVTLGARGAADNPTGLRHPQIGDDVQIAGNVRVLGPVHVGDGARVNAGAQVLFNVPARSRVSVVTSLQVLRPANSTHAAELVGITDDRSIPGRLAVFTKSHVAPTVTIICAETFEPHPHIEARRSDEPARVTWPGLLMVIVDLVNPSGQVEVGKCAMQLTFPDMPDLLVFENIALSRAIASISG